MKVSCPLCCSDDVLTAIPEVCDHITGDVFRILRCRACDIRFTRPEPDAMDRYYPVRYRGYSGLTRIALEVLYRRRVASWVQNVARPGDALEVGCGPGVMLEALRRRGWRVMGLERTESAAAAARDRGLDVLAGDIHAVPSDRAFDLIVLFQVLEHMPAPQRTLAACAARLKPGGKLIAAVPNAASWQARFGGRYWVHLDPPRHLFHFTPATLRRQLELAGLQVTTTRFVSFEHDPYGWVESSLSRLTRRPNVITRYLMGLEAANPRAVLSLVAALALAMPAAVMSATSWVVGDGAIMEMTGLKPREARQ